jgi:capsular polysaccharide biosynthesis protein
MQQLRAGLNNLWRYGWIIPLVMIVAVATTALVESVQQPIYEVTARVVVRPVPGLPDNRTEINAGRALEDRSIAGTFARMFTAPAQRDAAGRAAGLAAAEAANYQLAAILLPNTPTIEVSVTGRDPGAARNYLNSVLNVTTANTRNLFGAVDLLPLEPAQPPVLVAPQPRRDLPLATGLALLGGLLLALVVPYLREPPQDTPTPRMTPGRSTVASEPG